MTAIRSDRRPGFLPPANVDLIVVCGIRRVNATLHFSNDNQVCTQRDMTNIHRRHRLHLLSSEALESGYLLRQSVSEIALENPTSLCVRLYGSIVSRVESSSDRRVRTVALTDKGREMFVPLFRRHAALIKRAFQDVSPEELQQLEGVPKKVGKRAKSLAGKKGYSELG